MWRLSRAMQCVLYFLLTLALTFHVLIFFPPSSAPRLSCLCYITPRLHTVRLPGNFEASQDHQHHDHETSTAASFLGGESNRGRGWDQPGDGRRPQQQVRRHVRAPPAVHAGAAAAAAAAACASDELSGNDCGGGGGAGGGGRPDHAAVPPARRGPAVDAAGISGTAGDGDEGAADNLLRRAGRRVRRRPGREGYGAHAAGRFGVFSGAGGEGRAGARAADAGAGAGHAARRAPRDANREEGVTATIPPEEEAEDRDEQSIPEGGDGVAGAGEKLRRRQSGEG